MLPSPRWPKGTGRAPGIISSTSWLARATNSGTRATGTAISCLMLPPSCFCTSLISSRRRHRSSPCAGEEGGRGLGGAQAGHARHLLPHLGKETQHCRGDDAERPFRADDEVLEV